MNRITSTIIFFMATIGAIGAGAAVADDYEISWYSVDGGGATWVSGGSLELGGTVGQPDANQTVLTGGDFALVGGFWAAPPCWCLADVNSDGVRNGEDIQGFLNCTIAGGANCACADLDKNGVLDLTDINMFVSGLLIGGTCP